MSNLWEFMWETLPPGFRFHPTDEEFVNHYLTNYILGIKDDADVIPIVDDLFKRDPSGLPRLFRGSSSIIRSRDPEWWFLSTLRYKSPNSDKFDRSTIKGSWKITGMPKKIYHRGVNRQIAEMRNLVFCENPRNEDTNWVIHEYCLKDNSMDLTIREQRKHVLCHLVNRQYVYTETSTDMEVDLEFEEQLHGFSEEIIQAKIRSLMEEQLHGFSEEIIQAKIRSLMEGPSSPSTNASLHNPQELSVGPVDIFDEMEHVMSMSNGHKDDDIPDLLNQFVFPTDEESSHSDEFEVACFFEQSPEHEETSRPASNHAVLKKNRQARPLGTLEGYVVIDETRGFVEDDFQREEVRDVLSLPDAPKTPPSKYPMASPNEHSVNYLRKMEARSTDFRGFDHLSSALIERRQSTPTGIYHNFKEGKAKGERIGGTEPRSLTPEVRRNPSTRPQTLRPRAGNEKMPITSREKNKAGYGCRPPCDYLVNLGAGIVLLVLMILWLVTY